MSGPPARGLSRVPMPLLQQLAVLVEKGRVDCPLGEIELRDAGFGSLASVIVEALAGMNDAAVLGSLRLVVAERVNRATPRLDLVWSGPEAHGSVSRDTGMVLENLFETAERTVLVAGYSFDKPDILAPLHTAMKTRGVTATLFVDIDGTAPTEAQADAFAIASIDRFFRKVWTFGLPRPDVYFDRRTALPGPPWASLHAKCVVVDDARTLVTSANFTDRGHSRNIEVGVLIEDAAFGAELAGHWRLLIAAGLVRRYEG